MSPGLRDFHDENSLFITAVMQELGKVSIPRVNFVLSFFHREIIGHHFTWILALKSCTAMMSLDFL